MDIHQICTSGVSQRRLIPKFRPHVRVHIIEAVKLEDVGMIASRCNEVLQMCNFFIVEVQYIWYSG